MATATRTIRAPRGTSLTCKGWPQEAALRMLMNNLDPEVAEKPDELIVYGGTGKAARSLTRAREVVAVEILCACQAIDLLAPLTTSPALAAAQALDLRAPLAPSAAASAVRDAIRARVPQMLADRFLAPDIEAVRDLARSAALAGAAASAVGELR